jgi:hypothetical protein
MHSERSLAEMMALQTALLTARHLAHLSADLMVIKTALLKETHLAHLTGETMASQKAMQTALLKEMHLECLLVGSTETPTGLLMEQNLQQASAVLRVIPSAPLKEKH